MVYVKLVLLNSPVRCRAEGGITRRWTEKLGQVVKETREAPVQASVENGGEVRTEVGKEQTFTC